MKKGICIILTIVMLMSVLCGCGTAKTSSNDDASVQTASSAEPAVSASTGAAPEVKTPATREYTDDTGRSVTIPAEIKKIAISGPLTQMYVLPIAADMMVGSAMAFSKDAEKYLSADIINMPQLGQLYGGKGTMDLEGLLKAAPDIVLDVGEAKKTIADDFNVLAEQTGIPFIHIDATVITAPEAYMKLGELLGRDEKGKELSSYLQLIIDDVTETMNNVDGVGKRKGIIYCLGDDGLHVLANGSYHADTLKLVANNVAEVSDVAGSGDGNAVDMEQIMLWDPEVILFDKDEAYYNASTSDTWKNLKAIKSGNYYRVPTGPYGWLASPPAVQRYLGIMWLESILYPEECAFNLKDKVTEYYKLFYNYDLTDEDYNQITENALPKD